MWEADGRKRAQETNKQKTTTKKQKNKNDKASSFNCSVKQIYALKIFFSNSVISVRPVIGVYFKAKKTENLVNFPSAKPEPLEKEIYSLK